MKQVYQDVRTGDTCVADVAAPRARSGTVLVHVGASLVSAGTERMVVQFARKSLLQKIRARPDLARQVLDKARREGVLTALDGVRRRLDQPMPLGYSVAGTVLDAGLETPFQPGDRVACAGAGHAVHAEIVSVPRNLVVALPDAVSFDEACFATLGAVALHGVRLAHLELGGVAVVIGLGLVGQLTVQLLRAAGVTTIGMDLRDDRADLARRLGAFDTATTDGALEALVESRTLGRGADAVLVCADTPSDAPVALAAAVARDRGVVVAVGAVGLGLPRKAFFAKELEFRVSRSYGPGRYDPAYEDAGHDYPFGFVRWTEQRNMDAVVRLVADGQLRLDPLVTHRFDIGDAERAFDLVAGRSGEPFMAVVLQYPPEPDQRTRVEVTARERPTDTAVGGVGVVGAGLFANAIVFPILGRLAGLELRGVCANSGLAAAAAARRHRFAYGCTRVDDVLEDQGTSTVAILTRHSAHAGLVTRALEAGKNVFVEKPLCLAETELEAIEAARSEAIQAGRGGAVMVGFNRRFAPFVVETARALSEVREPLMLHYRVNAGFIPATHWTQQPEEGGRLVGEGCHFIDLLLHLAGQRPVRVTARALPDGGRYARDNFVVTLEFANGAIGTLTYVANGAKTAGKELFEAYGGGMAVRLDDYRRLTIHGPTGTRRRRALLRQDKGHRAAWEAFVGFLAGRRDDPMPFETIRRSTLATLAAARSLDTGAPVALPE